MPVVIAFRTGRVKTLVAFLVVGFLEQDVRANLGFLQHAVFLHRGCRDVHVHATDGAVFMLHGIDGAHRLQDVFDGVVLRIFACFDGQALMTHILQGNNLIADLFLSELPAGMVRFFA